MKLLTLAWNSIGLLLALGILGCLFRMKEGQIAVLLAVFALFGVGYIIKANHD